MIVSTKLQDIINNNLILEYHQDICGILYLIDQYSNIYKHENNCLYLQYDNIFYKVDNIENKIITLIYNDIKYIFNFEQQILTISD